MEASEGGRLRIDFDDAAITLAEPLSADDPVREHLGRREEGPHAAGRAEYLPFAAAHDARLEMRPSSRFG